MMGGKMWHLLAQTLFFFLRKKKINPVIKQPQIFAYAKRQNVPTWAHGFQMKIRSYRLCFLKCHMVLHIDLQFKLALSRTIAIGLKGNLENTIIIIIIMFFLDYLYALNVLKFVQLSFNTP